MLLLEIILLFFFLKNASCTSPEEIVDDKKQYDHKSNLKNTHNGNQKEKLFATGTDKEILKFFQEVDFADVGAWEQFSQRQDEQFDKRFYYGHLPVIDYFLRIPYLNDRTISRCTLLIKTEKFINAVLDDLWKHLDLKNSHLKDESALQHYFSIHLHHSDIFEAQEDDYKFLDLPRKLFDRFLLNDSIRGSLIKLVLLGLPLDNRYLKDETLKSFTIICEYKIGFGMLRKSRSKSIVEFDIFVKTMRLSEAFKNGHQIDQQLLLDASPMAACQACLQNNDLIKLLPREYIYFMLNYIIWPEFNVPNNMRKRQILKSWEVVRFAITQFFAVKFYENTILLNDLIIIVFDYFLDHEECGNSSLLLMDSKVCKVPFTPSIKPLQLLQELFRS